MPTTTTMNVSLPETMKSFVEERLESDGYGTASEYIRDLIRADQKRRAETQLETLTLCVFLHSDYQLKLLLTCLY